MSEVCSLNDDTVRYLSSSGPRTDAEVELFDSHIRECCKAIQESWTPEQKKIRAERAGAVYNPVEVTLVDDTSHCKRKVIHHHEHS